jgi:hypothetical protein
LSSKQLINYDLFIEAFSSPPPILTAAIESLAVSNETESRGAIYTRVEIVDFILDLVGYTKDKPLYQKRLLEPSVGGGEFLLQSVKRLLESWQVTGNRRSIVDELGNAIRAVELHRETFHKSRNKVLEQLMQYGINQSSATLLVDRWLVQGDFLLEQFDSCFDFVVGNPPYVRQELIPAPLLAEYRRRFHTLYDRADLYIPFIEHSLLTLNEGGNLGFICADRWMKNRYGGPLRKLVAERFHLKFYVDMVDTPAFLDDVDAYPAITVISREKPGSTRVAYRPSVDREALSLLAKELRDTQPKNNESMVRVLNRIPHKAEPWLLESSKQTTLIRRLETDFPTLEETGCKVGIGVATGADKAFIGNYDELDVELGRKLPLVTTNDIQSGEVQWRGKGVINPFEDEGGLVKLCDYPRLANYLNTRRDVIAKRHCALKSPKNWYRTIDRITPSIAFKPKLLIPDIKGEAHVVFEEGKFYPHHNLYYVTSETWDLRALQAVLLSSITRLFITTYSTKMRGGYFRFQAQYLRRIRLPHWKTIPQELKIELTKAAIQRDFLACDSAAFKLYALSIDEIALLEGNGE